jgi:hypothetical protein
MARSSHRCAGRMCRRVPIVAGSTTRPSESMHPDRRGGSERTLVQATTATRARWTRSSPPTMQAPPAARAVEHGRGRHPRCPAVTRSAEGSGDATSSREVSGRRPPIQTLRRRPPTQGDGREGQQKPRTNTAGNSHRLGQTSPTAFERARPSRRPARPNGEVNRIQMRRRRPTHLGTAERACPCSGPWGMSRSSSLVEEHAVSFSHC